MSDRRLGGIVQLGYVVDDLDEAMDHWARVLNTGPFFVTRHAAYRTFRYKDVDKAPDLSVAFAFSGSTNIELIQQHDETASVFRDFRKAHGQGLQHVGVLSTDLEADTKMLAAQGGEMILQLVNAENGVETRFYDTELHPGAMLELIDHTLGVEQGFAAMKAAAEQWDGRRIVVG